VTDPVTVSVIGSALRAITDEMSEALRRSSHSPIIREMLDYSCALFTASGETVAQDDIIPAFLGTMAETLPHVIGASDQLSEGDAFITNDPYRGGTHTPDIQLFIPILQGGELIGWAGNIAHHSDVGGTNPGTEGYANRSIFEEGLRIPPIRLTADGTMNEALLRLIENNIRDPESTAGDLRAQLAAAKLGVRRMHELLAKYGRPILVASMRAVIDASERRTRVSIAARPNGRAQAEGWLDDDGLGSDPIRICVSVEVADDSVIVDLDGTAPQMAGGLNMSQTAARAAVYFVVKAIFDPDSRHDGGALRAVDVRLPEGSVANPRFPAAVSLRHLAAQRLADTLVRAFGILYPDLATAGTFVGFSSLAASCAHPRTGTEVVIQDDLGGGIGAHDGGDGLDAVDTYVGNVQMLPAEICELQYPVRIVSTELMRDSGGAGEFRGGLGIRRVYEFLDTADCVFYTEQTRGEFAPQGIQGGMPGKPAVLLLERADGSTVRLGKMRVAVGRGDRLVTTTGGGGGFGDPRHRSRAAVRADLAAEKISRQEAEDLYGLEVAELAPPAHAIASAGENGGQTRSERATTDFARTTSN
jgi:N-methylhydantoinase B